MPPAVDAWKTPPTAAGNLQARIQGRLPAAPSGIALLFLTEGEIGEETIVPGTGGDRSCGGGSCVREHSDDHQNGDRVAGDAHCTRARREAPSAQEPPAAQGRGHHHYHHEHLHRHENRDGHDDAARRAN